MKYTEDWLATSMHETIEGKLYKRICQTNADGELIALVPFGKNCEANALLISAAPGNYERLKETTTILESLMAKYSLTGVRESLSRTIEANRQALAKAEGKENRE